VKRSKYTVIKDTREQEGWLFTETDNCLGTVVKTVHTGDYTLEGYEDKLCIERKATPDEICNNILLPRFYKELERMTSFKYRYMVFEFSLFDLLRFPQGSRIPFDKRPKILTGNFLLMKLIEIEIKYGVHIIYAGNAYNAQRYAGSLFKRVVDAENVKKET
jgi:ERCC4-type nuclease